MTPISSRLTLPACLLMLLLAGLPVRPAHADYESGRKAANRGDFAHALREWMPLALAGNADAQYGLGRMYARGDGVMRDFKEAARWFTLAAEQKHPKASVKLGMMYEYGDGVVKDEREAARYFALAAESGDAEAQSRLAALKRRGILPPLNITPVTPLLSAAAVPSQTPAQLPEPEFFSSPAASPSVEPSVEPSTLPTASLAPAASLPEPADSPLSSPEASAGAAPAAPSPAVPPPSASPAGIFKTLLDEILSDKAKTP